MEPLHMFVERNTVLVAREFYEEFAHAIEETGMMKFHDYSEIHGRCDTLARQAFGIKEDDCPDELGIFDSFADYVFHLRDSAEQMMFKRYMEGSWPDHKPKATRRAAEVLAECADLMEKKGAAYNGFPQAEYYPYGLRDIWYMCFTKVKRLESQIVRDGEANFEGVEDSARDLINYAAFLVEYAEGKMDGQK